MVHGLKHVSLKSNRLYAHGVRKAEVGEIGETGRTKGGHLTIHSLRKEWKAGIKNSHSWPESS